MYSFLKAFLVLTKKDRFNLSRNGSA